MRVGVLIPVFGFAPYLAEALDTVLAGAPAQVVVVDDGSPRPIELDEVHVAAGVGLVRRSTCGGAAAARATGLDALDASVSLVALCDADDAWSPGSLASRVAALEDDPGVGWAFGRALVVGPDGRPTGEHWSEPAAGRHAAGPFSRELFEQNPVPTSSVVLRRTALEAVGGFVAPVRVAEDWELWLRLARAGHDAVCVPEAVVRYRRHPAGSTADVTALATAQIAVRDLHAELVDPATRDAARARDLAALADGLARDGDASAARAALRALKRMRGLTPRERLKQAALAVPGGRRLLAGGDPYRG